MKKDHNDFQILATIEADSSVSQRDLSSQMRLNVASVNFALKGLVQKGYVTMEGENLRRTKYYITPEGIRKKTKLAYKSFGRNIQYFNEIRRDIESQILMVTKGREIDIAIYGVNELSEIVYMVVSKMGLKFQGFFIEESKKSNEKVFDYSVQTIPQLNSMSEYLWLITDKLSPDLKNSIETNNLEILDLVGSRVS
ncbi:MAG: winged helix-turn-helix transcriptional regulator [Candidatus Brocadiaceae bacterium]|nr:winged helix-turn-helix transcriptional regulator [Candidatus Brocadiaceae bacterium]